MIAPHLKHHLSKHHPPPSTETDDKNDTNQNDSTPPPPIPPGHPLPAYLPTSPSSPLTPNIPLYTSIASSPRTLLSTSTLPPRSGLSLPLSGKSILRISLPTGPQVVDLNCFAHPNSSEHFWASRTRQLQSSHLGLFDRLWSNLPYMRPMMTLIGDSLGPRVGVTKWGGRCHDLLGTRCDPYINHLLTSSTGEDDEVAANAPGQDYNYTCHSNLTRSALPHAIPEPLIHDVLNLFQVTGLDAQGRYFMEPCPAEAGDYVEFFVEMDVLVALSACPGGDLSRWGFGGLEGEEVRMCCREVRVEVFRLREDIEGEVLRGWRAPECPAYKGLHGMRVPIGEGKGRSVSEEEQEGK